MAKYEVRYADGEVISVHEKQVDAEIVGDKVFCGKMIDPYGLDSSEIVSWGYVDEDPEGRDFVYEGGVFEVEE